MKTRFQYDFFKQDALIVAKSLLGMSLVRKYDQGYIQHFIITETEAYIGEEDLACHASKGRTTRTEVMYHEGGVIYVYLIYGIHWMLNIVTGSENCPQAILIRGVRECSGPGRLGKLLELDRSFYGEDLIKSERIWIKESTEKKQKIKQTSRIGIDYAGDVWKNKPWRFLIDNQ